MLECAILGNTIAKGISLELLDSTLNTELRNDLQIINARQQEDGLLDASTTRSSTSPCVLQVTNANGQQYGTFKVNFPCGGSACSGYTEGTATKVA